MKKKGFSLFLDYVAAIILLVAVLATLFTGFNYLMFPAKKVQTIKIEYSGIKTDSVKSFNKNEIRKIDSLLKEIKTTSNQIQQTQLEAVEKKTDDSFYNKFYTAVVAIILALAGFFGFKSISEVKTQSVSDAKEEATKVAKEIAEAEATKVAQDVAKTEFEKAFTDEFQAGVYAQSNKAMTDYLRKEIGALEDRIVLLEQRLGGEDNNKEPVVQEPVEPIPDGDPIIEGVNVLPVKNVKDSVEPENPYDHE